MLLPAITFLDLETTGARPLTDKITEIALVRYDHGVETARWETLVNPEKPIPPFIQQLTGLDDEMVEDAPVFSDVAEELMAFLKGSVISAHNVRFDYGFLKAEFKRVGINLSQKVLCTVKLSRLLYPEFKSHGLDAIMKRHNIISDARHRAMGDVESVLAFLNAAQLALGEAQVNEATQRLMRGPTLPEHLTTKKLADMPETGGVFLFYGDNNAPIFISKSTNIRARVLAFFNHEKASAKEKRISKEVKHIEWIDTAGECSSLLLESKLVKEQQPTHNKRYRTDQQLCSWKLNEDSHAKPLLTLVESADIEADDLQSLYGTFKSKRQAREALRKIADLYQLCAKAVGLEQGKGACFAAQIKRCKGVCSNIEKPEIHYLRLKQALIKHQIKPWPYAGKIAIKEHNVENGLTQLHVFSHWHYEGCANDDAGLHELIESRQAYVFDLDIYKLLLKVLSLKKTQVLQLNF